MRFSVNCGKGLIVRAWDSFRSSAAGSGIIFVMYFVLAGACMFGVETYLHNHKVSDNVVVAIAGIMLVLFMLGLAWKYGLFEKDEGPPD
jgi:hypothetical protein